MKLQRLFLPRQLFLPPLRSVIRELSVSGGKSELVAVELIYLENGNEMDRIA